ncbi:hypothetical protein K466DRAFT_395423 [Polyporus arcularius HHB13444]|uniref:Uncharacterized protein n=1 Tax=Polyporus arcularius HHB13444 TaxID=1314778 RepID=A0A5C3NTI5_9APHY|nr:hypothetical protein K466DRAFT_395423 [Polyporus arcularius HHB13444]
MSPTPSRLAIGVARTPLAMLSSGFSLVSRYSRSYRTYRPLYLSHIIFYRVKYQDPCARLTQEVLHGQGTPLSQSCSSMCKLPYRDVQLSPLCTCRGPTLRCACR